MPTKQRAVTIQSHLYINRIYQLTPWIYHANLMEYNFSLDFEEPEAFNPKTILRKGGSVELPAFICRC